MPSARRIANIMQKQMLHSEHAARCYIEAERRERAAKRIGMCPWCGESLHPGRKCSNEDARSQSASTPK